MKEKQEISFVEELFTRLEPGRAYMRDALPRILNSSLDSS